MLGEPGFYPNPNESDESEQTDRKLIGQIINSLERYDWNINSLFTQLSEDGKNIAFNFILDKLPCGFDILEATEEEYIDYRRAGKLEREISDSVGPTIFQYLETHPEKEKEVVNGLLLKGFGYLIAKNASHLNTISREEILNYLIVDEHLENELTTPGQKLDDLANSLQYFSNIDRSVADKLICNAYVYANEVVEHIEQFQEITFQEIADKMIEQGQVETLAGILSKFKDVTFNRGNSLLLLEYGDIREIIDNLDKLQGISREEIALKLVGRDSANYNGLMLCIHAFPDIDPRKLAIKRIESGNPLSVDRDLSAYELENGEVIHFEKTYPEFFHLSEKLLIDEYSTPKDEEFGEGFYKNVFSILKEKHQYWQDESNIGKPFEAGANIFGYQKMFNYIDRNKTSLHDILYSFDNIISLFNASGMSADQFYGQILQQVKQDDSNYESGTAYHELNQISQTLDLSEEGIRSLADKMQKYQHIDRLKELIDRFQNPSQIFASWVDLKKFSELTRLIERAGILIELEELKNQAVNDPKKDKLYHFVETLAFHPDSKVNMQAVIQFWREPGKFLGLSDEHTPTNIQDSKKPSNYTRIPHLDLTTTELRDALVDGTMDELQAFPAVEVVYTITDGKEEKKSFFDQLKTGIGSRRDGTSNPTLFGETNKIFKKHNLNLTEYLQGAGDNINTLSSDDQQKFLSEISEAINKYPNQNIPRAGDQKSKRYRAKVNRKSDPQGVLAGNDTACCMYFGSGKNNIYMFNPNCSLFTLEEEKVDGAWRTIAQSVLTLDMDIKKSIPEVASALRESNQNISEILPDSVLVNDHNYISCDNIEIAGNAKDRVRLIESIYRDFFSQYTSFYNSLADQHVDEGRVIVGQGYSDLRIGSQGKNTFAPLAPVGYSDKMGDQVDMIDLKSQIEGDLILRRNHEIATKEEVAKNKQTGALPLSYKDSLAVAYLEGKAYSDNQSLITYLHNMENGLIAKDINNAIEGRANLSFKYVDSSGRMRGYILAYEGSEDGEQMIYISDLASDRESGMAGGRIINAFVDAYKNNYVDTGRLLPIYLEGRESTSYQIILNNLESISRKLGVTFEIEEKRSYEQGDDVMHPLWLRPISRQ